MKRTTITAVLVMAGLLVGTSSAAALSCAEPEPFDMAAAIADADAAAVGSITSILSTNETEYGDARLALYVDVTAVFKGTVSRHLTLERAITVWGPYYEEGTELALLIKDGVVSDGQDSLCGPYFYADDMRASAGTPTAPLTPTWDVLGMLRNLIGLLGRLLSS